MREEAMDSGPARWDITQKALDIIAGDGWKEQRGSSHKKREGSPLARQKINGGSFLMGKKGIIAAVFLAAVLTVPALWAAGVSPADSRSARSEGKRVLVVGMEAAFKPYEFRAPSGEIVGFDVDIVNALVKNLGWEVQYVDMAFDALIPSLTAGKIDMIASGMTATPQRAQRIDFTRSYYASKNSRDSIIVRPEDSMAGLDAVKGKVLAVQLGSTQDLFMTGLGTLGEIRRFKAVEDCMREVMLGRADFAFVAKTVTDNVLASKDFAGKLKVSAEITESAGNGVAFGFAKGNRALRDKVDQALGAYMETPAYPAAMAKWKVE